MINVLILADRKDAHSRIVADALSKKGASPIRWFSEEFLVDQYCTLEIDSTGKIELKMSEKCSFAFDEIDVVWFRRPRYPILPKDLHPEDTEFIKLESIMFMKSLWQIIGGSAQWINPFSSYDKANSKILQLKEAANIGMSIPETLISNNRNAIEDFINKNQPIETIYKTFNPLFWKEEDDIFAFQTTSISTDMLPEQSIIQLTPGIYQKRINKCFEIRVTFFGENYIAIKIHNDSKLDWRSLNSHDLHLSPTQLPIEIEKHCITLMKRLGIVFGCFDFIVTHENEYFFLEVNEMGQFLWIEEYLPEIRILDVFCDFLLSLPTQKVTLKNKKKTTLPEITNSYEYKSLLTQDINYQQSSIITQ